MLTLYHAPRSRAFRTLWLLEELGGSLPLLMSRQILPENDTFKAYAARITVRPAYARAQAKDASGE